MTAGARPGRSRALRRGVGTSALVLLVCALIAIPSGWTLGTVGTRVSAATARSFGEVVGSSDGLVQVRWSAAGTSRTDTVRLAVPAPPVGTRTAVAYDPRMPATVLVPGSTELATVDRAASGVAFSGLVAVLVIAVLAWELASRRRLRGLPAREVSARRVRVQSGLLTRSWLEIDSPPRWVPVHYDPVLDALPAPTPLWLHGKPRARRLVAARVHDRWLYPSGPVRATEPRGRRIDSPARPDPDAVPATGVLRGLRADAALLTPAPLIGLLWAYLDDGGVLTALCATVLAAALALWWAALRGTDPT